MAILAMTHTGKLPCHERSGSTHLIPTVSRRVLTLAAVIGLLAIMEAAMLLAARQESQTSDEAYSLFAGYLHLTAGDFSICPGYPPLAKDVSALPLLVLRPHVPPMTDAEASDFRGGRIFLYANRADRLLFAARAAMTVFPLLLAVIVFLATREMFGTGPGIYRPGADRIRAQYSGPWPLVTNDVALGLLPLRGGVCLLALRREPQRVAFGGLRDCGRLDPGGQALRHHSLSDSVSAGTGGIAAPAAGQPRE